MKKIISLILTLTLLVGAIACFASCGKNGDTDTIVPGKLVVAMSPDFSPMEFVDTSKSGTDSFVGFDVLLSNYIAKELGLELVIKPMSFDASMAAVQSGNADLAVSGFSWTAARAETFIISDYYIAGENETEQVVITTKANEGAFKSAEDFSGKKIGAQGGSLQQLLVEEQLVTKGAEIVKMENLNDLATALQNGQIDGLACAKGNGDAFIATSEGALAESGFEFFVEEKYKNNVILLNKNASALEEKVNEILAKALAAGLYDEWYAASEVYAGVSTLDENGYDDDGNKITDPENPPVSSGNVDDAAKKKPYEDLLAAILAK